jgi:hypothetical protein
MKPNLRQRKILIAGIVAMILTLAFPPFVAVGQNGVMAGMGFSSIIPLPRDRMRYEEVCGKGRLLSDDDVFGPQQTCANPPSWLDLSWPKNGRLEGVVHVALLLAEWIFIVALLSALWLVNQTGLTEHE